MMIPTWCIAWEPPEVINVVIPFASGSGNETSFRLVASQIEKDYKVKFIIRNMPGADGNLGMNFFVEQPNNGSWIAVPTCQNTFMGPSEWKDVIKYDPMSLTYVSNLAKSPVAIIANSNSDITSPTELIRAMKLKKRDLMFAVGSPNHKLVFSYLVDFTNPNNHNHKTVPYKSPGAAAHDVAGGHVEFGIVSMALARSLATAGKIKIIGIADDNAVQGFENVPLLKNTVPGLVSHACFDLVLPPNSNTDIQKWFVDVFKRTLVSEPVSKAFRENLLAADKKELDPDGVLKGRQLMIKKWSKYTH
jgi:tripartite-type tricarboxylate transporter receptor subunit TctC